MSSSKLIIRLIILTNLHLTLFVVVHSEIPDNMLTIFYPSNDCPGEQDSDNTTQVLTDVNSTITKLCMKNVMLTNSLGHNLRTFSEILDRGNVVALLTSTNSKFPLPFMPWGNQGSDIPLLSIHYSESAEIGDQNPMHVNVMPPYDENIQSTLDVLHRRMWPSTAVIFNTKNDNIETMFRLKESRFTSSEETGNVHSENTIQYFKMISGLSNAELIRQSVKILVNIRVLRIHDIVVYGSSNEVHHLFMVADLLQMLGAKYSWILPWDLDRETKEFPTNAMTLRLKNVSRINLWLDSVEVIKRSFHNYVKKRGESNGQHNSCFGSYHNSCFRGIYGHILSQSFVGKTGKVSFDVKTGNRKNADYELVSLNNDAVLVDEPNLKRLNKVKRRKTIRAVTALTEPFASVNELENSGDSCGTGLPCSIFSKHKNTSEKFCCNGLIVELLRMLQTDLYVDVVLHASKDGMYGALDLKTNTWNGMIGEVVRGEADMAIADLTITDSRSRVVDFTQPFMEIGSGIIVRVSRIDAGNGIWSFLKPVASELWLAVILTILAMGIVFWAMERGTFRIFDKLSLFKKSSNNKSKLRFSIGASMHFTWTTIVRTRDRTTRPSNTGTRIGALGLAICFLVFITTYTAQLAAFLVAEEEVAPLTGGIRDSALLNPSNNLKMAVTAGTSTEDYFRRSSEPLYRNIWESLKNTKVPSLDIGLEYLREGKIDVYFHDYTTLVYHAAKDKECSLQVLGKPFFNSGFGIAFPKNSSWTPLFSQKLLDYQKHDDLLPLAHRWLKSSCEHKGEKADSDGTKFAVRRMSTHDLSGLFVVVTVGVMFSAVLLPFEFYFNKRKYKRRADITSGNCKQLPEVSGTSEFDNSELHQSQQQLSKDFFRELYLPDYNDYIKKTEILYESTNDTKQ